MSALTELRGKTDWFARLSAEYAGGSYGAAQNYYDREAELFAERNRFSFYQGTNPLWLMDHNERAGLYMVLGLAKPHIIIEIGARFGGSTALFSQFADHVYAIDIDPGVRDRCSHMDNVTVEIGNSATIVPRLIERINAAHGGWDFALVDGDHSADGVRNDLNALIRSRPLRRAYVMMHDSFNPECRKGILAADWHLPWVQNVEIDFTIGNLMPQPHVLRQMWGGLALAEIAPEDRTGPLAITQTARLAFEAALAHSAKPSRRPLYRRAASRIRRALQANF